MTRRARAVGYAIAARFIAKEEGFRSRAYPDVRGIPTIGFGRTEGVRLGQTTTYARELAWFTRALRRYAQPIRALKADLTPRMFAALLSLSYNIGPAALSDTARWEIARDLHAHRWDQVGDDFDRYANPPVLQGRRDREQAMYRKGLRNLKRRRARARRATRKERR